MKCLSGKTGNKRFLLRYKFNSCKCSITIGRFPNIDINQARNVDRKYKGMIADCIDPKAERDNQVDYRIVKSFFYDSYLPLAKRRKKTWIWMKVIQELCNTRYN